MLEFTEDEIHARAVKLGYAPPALTPQQLAKVKVLLIEERRAIEMGAVVGGASTARAITIRPGVSIEVDGYRLPAASEPIEIKVSDDPDVPATVRLTLLADTVQTIKEN